MNPIYKFALTANGTTQMVYPIYGDGLTKDFEKESGQEFFRAKLSGELTFESADYEFIAAQAFDEQFVFEIAISYDAGVTLIPYWRGTFWKTDCKFDDDAETVVVKPSVYDQYNDVLAGMDREYNLIELAPAIIPVKADKRPMIQVYVPGQSVIGCFLAGMWWEQDCDPESDETKLVEQGDGKLNFSLNKSFLMADVSGNVSPVLPEQFTGAIVGTKFLLYENGTQDFPNGDYILRYYFMRGGGGFVQRWQILLASNETVMWEYSISGGGSPTEEQLPLTVVLNPVSGTGATGDVSLYVHEFAVYSRYICDTDEISSVPTYEIGTDDIVPDNRNYRRVVGYYFPDTIYFSTALSETPTQWGLYQPGKYYQQPTLYWSPELFPVARNAWGRASVWFTFSAFDWAVEQSGREPFTIKHAYPLFSVLAVLLREIAPGVSHYPTTDYSQFLYGTNLVGIAQTLLITPKSNIVTAGYDQPAQKAPITLRAVLDMLRNCFRCYWFIDDQGRFRVEHIQYFRNGGSYSGTPVVGVDLTTEEVTRTGKKWAYARNQYEYDKPAMASRYQFGWMDDVTELFAGHPINILSRFVNPENIEQIQVAQFTSDLDYILLNPADVSKDGFVLLSAIYANELEQPETYTYSEIFSFRVPVPDGWKGQTIRITCNVSTGSVVFRVLYPGGLYQTDPVSNGTVSLYIPENATGIYVINGTTGAQITVTAVYAEEMALPYVNYDVDGNDHYLQNAYVAFCILQQYYAYDMPAPDYEIDGMQYTAIGVKRMKKQSIRYPAIHDPDLFQLVKTNLGNGSIEKISVNLSSRNANATLKYDIE